MANKPERGVIFLCKSRLTHYAAETEINLLALQNSNSNYSLTNTLFTVITGRIQEESSITGGRGGSNEAEKDNAKGVRKCAHVDKSEMAGEGKLVG